MSAVADNERFRRPCVESRGRLRAGSQDHASAWRLPDGCFGWCLDAGGERVRPGTPRTRAGWPTRAGRSAGRAARSTIDGSSGGTASHGTPRRAGIPSSFHAAATGDGATVGAAHRLTATASDPTFQCPASRSARGGAAARTPSGADSTATSGHGAADDAAYCRPLPSQHITGRERAAVAAGADRAARTTASAAGPAAAARDAVAPDDGAPDPNRTPAAARAATAIA